MEVYHLVSCCCCLGNKGLVGYLVGEVEREIYRIERLHNNEICEFSHGFRDQDVTPC